MTSLLSMLWAATPASAVDTGALEICKSADNGMGGRAFQFSINGGAPITVTGGSCSSSMQVPSGNATIVEAPTAGLEVSRIVVEPSGRGVGRDLATGRITVRVVGGTTAATETLVTFTNRPATGGLKVCKYSATTSIQGASFSFTNNNGSLYSVVAGPPGAPNCSAVRKYRQGTRVTVRELGGNGTVAQSIVVSDGRGSSTDLANRSVVATIGPGITTVTYDNEFPPPPSYGYIEVCKAAGDQYVQGSFNVTITAPGFSDRELIPVGQCTPPLRVPAGNVTVTESVSSPYYFWGAYTYPDDRLVDVNTDTRSTIVTVPAGDESTETQLTLVNATLLAQVKVCKSLAANSAALTGRTFTFDVNSTANGSSTLTVIAGAAGSTTCKQVPGWFPLGDQVAISERPEANVALTGVSIVPSGNGSVSGGTANIVVGSGITTATFTNQALGTLEVCKNAADASTSGQTFQFSVNGGSAISVRAGQCSGPIQVPAGNATVRELSKANFALVSVTALGPGGVNRRLTGPTDNPATVSVPFGGVADETVVTFTNRVLTGQFKICKASPDSSLQGITFSFTYSYVVNGVTTTGGTALQPGQCSALSSNIPVQDANGNPVTVNVAEQATAGTQVSSITLDGAGTLTASNTAAGSASFTIGSGFTALTYTNVRTALPSGGGRLA
ncbi:MAG: hypothetical protein HYX34_11855 [Actinobacteria bacterium]|nr:hypothetical protein [Actinomycetota bacterium]